MLPGGFPFHQFNIHTVSSVQYVSRHEKTCINDINNVNGKTEFEMTSTYLSHFRNLKSDIQGTVYVV